MEGFRNQPEASADTVTDRHDVMTQSNLGWSYNHVTLLAGCLTNRESQRAVVSGHRPHPMRDFSFSIAVSFSTTLLQLSLVVTIFSIFTSRVQQ